MVKHINMKTIGLIPVRLKSKRLYQKSLLPIRGLPLFVHVYKRAKMSKFLDELYVCCDDKKIIKICKKYNVKSLITSKKHANGTERILEASNKIKKKYDLIVDIQGDEPLLNPQHIDRVINFHKKNKKMDIILPSLKSESKNNPNIIKIAKNKDNIVLYLSRNTIPYCAKNKYIDKHLSIISFRPNALIKFAKSKRTKLEKIENIELLRALEIGLKIKSFDLKGESFSVDVKKDYLRAVKKMQNDKYFKKYQGK